VSAASLDGSYSGYDKYYKKNQKHRQ
jgi:hypothetical protein